VPISEPSRYLARDNWSNPGNSHQSGFSLRSDANSNFLQVPEKPGHSVCLLVGLKDLADDFGEEAILDLPS